MRKSGGRAVPSQQRYPFKMNRRLSDPLPSNALPAPPDVLSPAFVFADRYLFQSYFDSTLLEKAILEQTINDPIVPSTSQEQQIAGYAVGLHPSSQTPIAVRFRQGSTSAASQALILKPGQVIKPSGGQFSGVRYGLPFGWLGGGAASLVIFTTPDSNCAWGENAEIIYHRARYKIYQPAQLGTTLVQAAYNWPLTFPWQKALRGTTSINQGGKALLSVTPTKTLMTLRNISSLANPAEMTAIFSATDDFGLGGAGYPDFTLPPVSVSVMWPSWSNYGSGGFTPQNPVLSQDDIWTRLSANQGGLTLVDSSGSAALNNAYVDIVRYGRL